MNQLIQINLSKGGVPKLPIPEAVVTKLGISGDQQKDLQHHGGPDRAVSLFSVDLIEQLRLEGHPIAPGTTGENLTITVDDYAALKPGCTLAIGEEVELLITAYAPPCKTIKASFHNDEFIRISDKVHPGWSRLYASVLKEGLIRQGDAIVVHHAFPAE